MHYSYFRNDLFLVSDNQLVTCTKNSKNMRNNTENTKITAEADHSFYF